MHISVLGSLKPDPHVPAFLVSEPLSIPFFDGQQLPVTVVNLTKTDGSEVEAAISSFLKLGRQERLEVSRYVFANYHQTAKFAAAQGYDLDCRIASEEAIWQHVQASALFIDRRDRRDCAIYVSVLAECDWEPEHGLQIVYRRGSELVRVSQQDGHLTYADACDLPEDQDRIVD